MTEQTKTLSIHFVTGIKKIRCCSKCKVNCSYRSRTINLCVDLILENGKLWLFRCSLPELTNLNIKEVDTSL
jgi:hypothetical protein